MISAWDVAFAPPHHPAKASLRPQGPDPWASARSHSPVSAIKSDFDYFQRILRFFSMIACSSSDQFPGEGNYFATAAISDDAGKRSAQRSTTLAKPNNMRLIGKTEQYAVDRNVSRLFHREARCRHPLLPNKESQPASPNHRHFGRGACSARCSGVCPKTACSLATCWRFFSRRSLRRAQLPRTILKAPTASCRVATLGSRSSAEAARPSALMSFSRANVWASSAPSCTSHATFPFHQPPVPLPT